MPRGVPNGKSPSKGEREALLAQARRDLAAMPDKDVLVDDINALLAQERLITDNERINITVEYACLGQEPKPEKYIGRPRYIKASRHGRTRLAKRSARRDDIPPPEEKMFVYDDEVARYLHGAKYPSLRKPGTEYVPKKNEDEPMEEDDHKEHSRDSGCPVSPADKQDKKDNDPGSSRGSMEKESRKRRSPDLLAEEANASSGTSHFIVKGNTPLTIIHKLLERKRQVPADLRLELMDASGKEILTDDEMRLTMADLANQRGWTRNRPLRILYTITRFTESEDLPVLDVQARCDVQQQGSPAVLAPQLHAGPSQAQLQQMQQFHFHQQQRMQHMQQQQHHQQHQQYQPQMALLIQGDGSQIAMPYEQLLAMQQHDPEALLKLSHRHSSPQPPHQWAPPHHAHHYGGGGMLTPPTSGPSSSGLQPLQPAQLQAQMTSSIFPPGHVLIEHAHGAQLVSANASVESVISNAASVKKRQRMAPRRTKERDELMARKGIERGTTFTGSKGRGTMGGGMPPGIVSIRMPPGCNPKMLEGPDARDLPIEAITVDGLSHPTTIRELESGALSKIAAAAQAAAVAKAQAEARAAAQPPPLQMTPPEMETIPIVRTTRPTSASCSSSEADVAAAAAPLLTAEAKKEETKEASAPPPLSPPPRLDVSELPDSPRSLEIDERMDEEPPRVAPAMQRIPA